MSFSNSLESGLLAHQFGNVALSVSGFQHIALSTTTPTDIGDNFTEPSTNDNYARVQIENVSGFGNTWDVPTTGAIWNASGITFNQATGGSWGTITYFGIYDHTTATGVNDFLAWGQLDTAKSIDAGDTAEFAISGINITLD